jgi:hypothetical protein
MDSMTQVEGPIHLGLDAAKNAIVVGVVLPGREGVDVHRIAHDEASIRRLAGQFDDRSGAAGLLRGRVRFVSAAALGGWPATWSPRR